MKPRSGRARPRAVQMLTQKRQTAALPCFRRRGTMIAKNNGSNQTRKRIPKRHSTTKRCS